VILACSSRHVLGLNSCGAWLFVVWDNSLHRPTKDVDLLGYGRNDKDELLAIFKSIARSPDNGRGEPHIGSDVDSGVVPEIVPDGVTFLSESFTASDIDKDGEYHGVRVRGIALLDTAKIHALASCKVKPAASP
jgi:hypothetical protein